MSAYCLRLSVRGLVVLKSAKLCFIENHKGGRCSNGNFLNGPRLTGDLIDISIGLLFNNLFLKIKMSNPKLHHPAFSGFHMVRKDAWPQLYCLTAWQCSTTCSAVGGVTLRFHK